VQDSRGDGVTGVSSAVFSSLYGKLKFGDMLTRVGYVNSATEEEDKLPQTQDSGQPQAQRSMHIKT
jgi:hypothetical protein